jgi:Asp-tRNA(Asn)/Glu-tRNA(Gln) amidotransferase A subunit family amidase
MGRTVGDLRALFEVLRGPDAEDALTAPVIPVADQNMSPPKIRIGILEGDGLGNASPETQAAVRHAAQLLAYRGFILEPFRLKNLERVLELWWFFFGTVIGKLFESEIQGREDLLSPVFRDYFSAAMPASHEPISMERFVAMCAARDRERAGILDAMADIPILLSPVCSAPAFRHTEGHWKSDTGYRNTMRHSQWLNLAGFPGVIIPIGQSREGLPIGVQLVGRPYEDEMLMDVAEELELQRGRWQPPPP